MPSTTLTRETILKALHFQLLAMRKRLGNWGTDIFLSGEKIGLVANYISKIEKLPRSSTSSSLKKTIQSTNLQTMLRALVKKNSQLVRKYNRGSSWFICPPSSKGTTAKLSDPKHIKELARKYDQLPMQKALRSKTLVTNMKKTLFVLFEKYAGKIQLQRPWYSFMHTTGEAHRDNSYAFEQARLILTTLKELGTVSNQQDAVAIFKNYLNTAEWLHTEIDRPRHVDIQSKPHMKLQEYDHKMHLQFSERKINTYAARYAKLEKAGLSRAAFKYCQFNYSSYQAKTQFQTGLAEDVINKPPYSDKEKFKFKTPYDLVKTINRYAPIPDRKKNKMSDNIIQRKSKLPTAGSCASSVSSAGNQ